MNTIAKSVLACLLAGLLAAPALAASDTSELDTRFSAKVAKERTRANTLQRQQERLGNAGGTDEQSQCGSQNIGNVNTGGRIGSQPREVFVFAPNSVNVVTGRGCR